MARLSYDEFKEYCMKNVVKVLGESKYGAISQPIKKSDEIVIDSVQITEKNSKPGHCPSFRVQPFYLDYCNGKPLGGVILDILKTIEGFLDNPPDLGDPNVFNGFDNAKDNLIIRPISYASNKKLLQDHVHKQFDDVAVVLYMLMQHSGETLSTAKVPKLIAEEWGLNGEFLLQVALENTARLFPPFILPLELTLQGAEAFPRIPGSHKFFMDPNIPFKLVPSEINTYYLSIEKGINGASAAFYPGVLEKLASIFDDDLYILLPCIREAMIHPALSSKMDALNHVAKAMIDSLDPLERLSPSVFHYSRSDKKFRMV
ncbi:MAG: DUF5688 family protein [Synergistaceae bacterium]|nr:DUF5688 family protein [Synergistaceae bacterium]